MKGNYNEYKIVPGPVCIRTIHDAEGSYVESYARLPENGGEEELHRHPMQTVRLEAVEGRLGIMLDDRRLIVQPGSALEIPRNTAHALYNPDEKEIVFRKIVRPALHTEWLSREMKALSKRKQTGILSLIERSYILNQIRGEYYRSGIPAALQNAVHAVFALIGKWTGLNKRINPVQ